MRRRYDQENRVLLGFCTNEPPYNFTLSPGVAVCDTKMLQYRRMRRIFFFFFFITSTQGEVRVLEDGDTERNTPK